MEHFKVLLAERMRRMDDGTIKSALQFESSNQGQGVGTIPVVAARDR